MRFELTRSRQNFNLAPTQCRQLRRLLRGRLAKPVPLEVNPETHPSPELQEFDVMMALSKIKKTATGSDGWLFWVWRDNCTTLAPMVTALWNRSLSCYTWPTAWKEANISPLSKVDTPVQYSDFRGINVTPVIARCFERTVHRHYCKKVFEENLPVAQYAYREGCTFTNALIQIQYNYLKALDYKDCNYVRLFAMDFSKAFEKHFSVGEKLN